MYVIIDYSKSSLKFEKVDFCLGERKGVSRIKRGRVQVINASRNPIAISLLIPQLGPFIAANYAFI